VEEHALAAGYDRGQHDERVEARRGEDDHPVRMWLFERLEQDALVLVADTTDIRDQRHAAHG